MKTIGIIGTAGRGEDFAKLDLPLYVMIHQDMLDFVKSVVGPDEEIALVSGGAAWMDHLAVSLYLGQHVKKLTLHFPAEFLLRTAQFADTRDGRVANYYHDKFSRKVYPNEFFSREMIKQVMIKGAGTTVSEGFLARNALVAQDADILIAVTFGEDAKVKDGGTHRTMSQFLQTKSAENAYHLSLPDRVLYNAEVNNNEL